MNSETKRAAGTNGDARIFFDNPQYGEPGCSDPTRAHFTPPLSAWEEGRLPKADGGADARTDRILIHP